jgi:hypothetical protein
MVEIFQVEINLTRRELILCQVGLLPLGKQLIKTLLQWRNLQVFTFKHQTFDLCLCFLWRKFFTYQLHFPIQFNNFTFQPIYFFMLLNYFIFLLPHFLFLPPIHFHHLFLFHLQELYLLLQYSYFLFQWLLYLLLIHLFHLLHHFILHTLHLILVALHSLHLLTQELTYFLQVIIISLWLNCSPQYWYHLLYILLFLVSLCLNVSQEER